MYQESSAKVVSIFTQRRTKTHSFLVGANEICRREMVNYLVGQNALNCDNERWRKPQSIIINDLSKVKLIFFGVCVCASRLIITGT